VDNGGAAGGRLGQFVAWEVPHGRHKGTRHDSGMKIGAEVGAGLVQRVKGNEAGRAGILPAGRGWPF